jgi:ligand-binding sensor domain-containing protein
LKNIWEPFDSLPAHVEWNPEVFPTQYPWLAPYYVMDEYLNRYEMICAAKDFQCVWIGTRGGGVYKYSTVNYQAECYMLGIPGGKVTSIWKDEEYLWLGCAGGIVRWNPTKNTHIYYSRDKFYGPSPSKITSIVGNESYIWVGTEKGVFQFDKKEEMWSTFPISNALPSKYVTSLTVDNNKLWIGTQNGLASLELGRSEEIFKDIWVNDVKINKGELWIATSKGVLRKTKESWKKFEDSDKILSHGVYRILFKDNRIYFATNRQGVLVWEAKKWKKFTYPVYLPGEQIFSIACDKNNLYVGTDKGVAVCALDSSKWKQYDCTNSPIGGEVYAIYVDEKVVYFGTASGLVSLVK